MSTYLRMAITVLVNEKKFPFESRIVPNDVTQRTMQETREIGKRLEVKYNEILFDE